MLRQHEKVITEGHLEEKRTKKKTKQDNLELKEHEKAPHLMARPCDTEGNQWVQIAK
jgi:ribosome-associated protein YbcJ (S4-like RNA binding protein)